MSICDEPRYTCNGETRSGVTGFSKDFAVSVRCDRSIDLMLGTNAVPLQKRTREFDYTDEDGYVDAGLVWIMTLDVDVPQYSPCYTSRDAVFGAEFSDSYSTLDSVVSYLDLRYDVAVTEEVADSFSIDNSDSSAPGNVVSVFTGYGATGYHPFMFESIPITEIVTHNLYIAGNKTVLTTQTIPRAYPGVYLLMRTFPTSGFGIRIDTEWAAELDWYRSDQHEIDDGDCFLFWADYHRQCGKLSQSMDSINAGLVYALDGQSVSTPITGAEPTPTVPVNKLFQGSVAFDANKNIFYSMAVPTDFYLVNPPYALKQKLIVNGSEIPIPTDAESDAWWPVAPL